MNAIARRQVQIQAQQDIKDEAEIQVMASRLNRVELEEEDEILKSEQIIRPEMKTPDKPPIKPEDMHLYIGQGGRILDTPKIIKPHKPYNGKQYGRLDNNLD
jgi:hypothetical protein